MKIKTCLITAAGLGTRMGKVGEKLPKPLWPIFNKTLLDLQVAYVRELGVENIYINSHHCSEVIEEWAADKDIVILKEEQLLGSGGCIHNLKNEIKSDESILIINSDQFYFFESEFYLKAVESLAKNESCAHLFAISVNKNEKYNETVVVDNKLVDICKSKNINDYLTYSGVGLINLSKINYIEGKSSFFDTVCDYKNNVVEMSLPNDTEFWDFGTEEKYVANIKRLIETNNTCLHSFLNRHDVSINSKEELEKSEQLKLSEFGLEIDFRKKEDWVSFKN